MANGERKRGRIPTAGSSAKSAGTHASPPLIQYPVPIIFPIPHRPTILLVESAACKSLKILEVASRALASLLIREREI